MEGFGRALHPESDCTVSRRALTREGLAVAIPWRFRRSPTSVDERQQSCKFQRQSRSDGRGPETQPSPRPRLPIGQGFEDFQCGPTEIIDTGQIDDDVCRARRMLKHDGFELGRSRMAEPAFDE